MATFVESCCVGQFSKHDYLLSEVPLFRVMSSVVSPGVGIQGRDSLTCGAATVIPRYTSCQVLPTSKLNGAAVYIHCDAVKKKAS